MNHPSLRHPGRWIWLLLLVPVILGIVRLRFDVEVFGLLPPDLEVVQGLKLYQEHFANARQLIITVEADTPEAATAAARTVAEALRGRPELVANVTWEPPWEESPGQASELLAYLWFNQAPPLFAQLTNRFLPDHLTVAFANAREELATSLSPEEIARLTYDPLGLTKLPQTTAGAIPAFGQGQDMFSSNDGRFRIIFVEARRELRTYKDCTEWLAAIEPVAQHSVAGMALGKRALGFTGRPAFVAEVARSMQFDMTASVIGTAAIIAVLFWIAHKRIKPMLWLLTLLAAILGCTLALGGLIFGTINVISMGFAAILLGLAVDYAVVHYQEALAHPKLSVGQVRHAIAPSIFWAAATTISAFLILNLGGLPGLGQLGTLVGLGVALSASIMIFEFLPPLFPDRAEPNENAHEPQRSSSPAIGAGRRACLMVFGVTGALICCCLATLLLAGLPAVDSTANALRPRRSPAYAALGEIQRRLNQRKEPLWLLVRGSSEADVAHTLTRVQDVLEQAVRDGRLAGFTLPAPLWPDPNFQVQNRAIALSLASAGPSLRQAAAANGFTSNALALTERMLTTWERAGASKGVFWPTNRMSQWVLDRVVARGNNHYLTLGLLNAPAAPQIAAGIASLAEQLPKNQVWLTSWELLGQAIFNRVRSNYWKVLVPMVVLVLLSLWFAFRKRREIVLSLSALLMSGLCLLVIMRLAGWSWNLLNLMAIPLILGTGVDYSIFMQLALRRYRGDRSMAHFAVGRALLLCGGTAIAGFGALALSSNAGMASLGRICAIGIAANMLIAVLLLPTWWYTARYGIQTAAGNPNL